LVINLEIQPASIRPGNFHVLRNATVPAILGEPAMISHPVMAERLSLAAGQRLEAEAYFLGLLDYFSGGLPAWSGAATDTVVWGGRHDATSISWRFLADGSPVGSSPATLGGMPGADPTQFRLTLDGRPVTPQLSPDASVVTWQLPASLAPTLHTLELSGRNLAGRATPRRRTVLLPRTAPTLELSVTLNPETGRGGLHWRGIGGAPLPTGTLRLDSGRQWPVGPAQSQWILVENLTANWTAGTATFQAAGDTIAVPCHESVAHVAPGQRLHLTTYHGRPFAPPAGWRGRLSAGGDSPLVTAGTNEPLWLEGRGVLPLIDARPDSVLLPRTVAVAAPQ